MCVCLCVQGYILSLYLVGFHHMSCLGQWNVKDLVSRVYVLQVWFVGSYVSGLWEEHEHEESSRIYRNEAHGTDWRPSSAWRLLMLNLAPLAGLQDL